ncbi:Drug/Metabolite Transporter (DMT) Superfamily [Thraustotheca clavata]|uniref:Drug/Metabolite Transporter (DMT) Superfamily n=1 Tax=Thraustotheca clavata TaxID=74557 RepID=A0A1V9YSR3_9STRA|nr:Drug/Metabolite Transporter (DMT) Superfamily [Thraustotheca clavata]
MTKDVDAYASVMGPSRPRAMSWSSDNPSTAILYMICWYAFSTTATFINKILIKEHGLSAEVLTVCHLVLGTCFDMAIFAVPAKSRYKTWYLHPMKMTHATSMLPLSIMAIATKMLTYWSYSKIPVAFTHTCKASTPLFNVVLAFIVYRTIHPSMVYLSLLPIVIGVSMASISEVQINDLATTGLLCAISSSMFGVMQSMYSKYLLRTNIVADSINLHFYNNIFCIFVNLPMLYWNNATKTAFPSSVPYMLILCCSTCSFISSFAATLLLGKVSELTYSIMSTMKRVVIVLSAILYFGNAIRLVSILGMAMALGGVATYQYVKIQASKKVETHNL